MHQQTVRASVIKIENLAQYQDEFDNYMLSGEFKPLPSHYTSPPFPDMVKQTFEKQLNADGKGQEIEIRILRANLYADGRVADDIPFVGILSAAMSRAHKCAVHLSIDSPNTTKRVEITFVDEFPRHWLDSPSSVRETFIESCLSKFNARLGQELN